jgi:hypothetical protein
VRFEFDQLGSGFDESTTQPGRSIEVDGIRLGATRSTNDRGASELGQKRRQRILAGDGITLGFEQLEPLLVVNQTRRIIWA